MRRCPLHQNLYFTESGRSGSIDGRTCRSSTLRVLQKRLAKEVTVMVHSEEDYNAAVEASGILFGNATSEALKKLDEDTLLAVFEGVPSLRYHVMHWQKV